LFDWSNRLMFLSDPEYSGGFKDFLAAHREMDAYVTEHSRRRRAEPGDDIWSGIVRVDADGASLSDSELRMFWQLLVVAGNETTRNTISGGVVALLEHPEQLARVRDDPEIVPRAIEELLRWVSPVQHFRRTTTQDTVLAGTPIAAGTKVVVYYPSANRDAEVFVHPDELDVTREHNPHLAFGNGPHFCLGANLARMQLRKMIPAILTRLPGLRLAGPVERAASTFLGGIRHAPIAFDGR
jgi:cytochrome P450